MTLVEMADGHVDAHVHSFETTFYVLAVYFGAVGVKLRASRFSATGSLCFESVTTR